MPGEEPGTRGAAAHLLAIDLGTSGLKLAVVTTEGAIVGSTVEPFALHVLPGGGAEQDPEEWWRAVVGATRRVMASTGVDPGSVVGAGCSSQWSGTVPVDLEGRPLTRAIIWMDSRGAPYVRRIVRGFPMVQGYGLRKLARWIRRTGGAPGHSGKDPIAHILFVREELPEVYERTHKFLEPRDWINLRLTGRMATSFDAVTLHWVADTRDIHDVRYDRRLLAMAGLDRDRLPDIVPAASLLGPLAPEAAEALGLPESVRVVTGAPDIMAAAIGAGAVRDFDTHLCIGTSSWLVCHVPDKKTDLFHNMATLPSAIPGRYLLSNEQESAGICLTLLRDRLLFPPGDGPSATYEDMLAMAATVPAGSDGLIFTPWLNGERTPVDDRTARGGFFNQSLETTRAHLIRAVLEGVAFNSRWLQTYVEKFIKRRLDAVTVVGGGAQSDLWCQIHADVLGRPVRQARDPVMANARGAAFQAAVALGYLSWDDVPGLIPIARAFEPDPAAGRVYEPMFAEFVNLYRSTRKIHARLNAGR
jgi:xylulokinase